MSRQAIELPSAERLNEILFYDEEDGELYCRIDRGPRKAGMLAGCLNKTGLHVVIAIDGVRYLAHRIVWKMKTGRDPLQDIDHKDTDGTNNRWDNLREATPSQNLQNMSLSKANTSGVKGVSFDRDLGKWCAEIMKDRKRYKLGYFVELDDAKKVIEMARAELHGEFARSA